MALGLVQLGNRKKEWKRGERLGRSPSFDEREKSGVESLRGCRAALFLGKSRRGEEKGELLSLRTGEERLEQRGGFFAKDDQVN